MSRCALLLLLLLAAVSAALQLCSARCPAPSPGAGSLLSSYPNASSSPPPSSTTSSASTPYSLPSGVSGLALDSAGNVFVGDGSGRVLQLSPDGALLRSFPDANRSLATHHFTSVTGVAVSTSGVLYAVDADGSEHANGGYGRVVVLSPNGTLLQTIPDAKSSIPAARQPVLYEPQGVAVDAQGRVYIATGRASLIKVAPNGTQLASYPRRGSGYTLDTPYGVALDSAGNVWVTDVSQRNGTVGTGRLLRLSRRGALLAIYPNSSSPATSCYSFRFPTAVAVDRDGRVYVGDAGTDGGGVGRVVVLSATGELLAVFANMSSPSASSFSFARGVSGVAVDGSGRIHVAKRASTGNSTDRVDVLGGVGTPTPCSSSHPSSSPSPSSTAPPSSSSSDVNSTCSSTRLVGWWSQSFHVSGAVGGVYNLLSDAAVQLNAYVVQLQHIRCPREEGHTMQRCLDEQGTYFGVLAIAVRTGEGEVQHVRVTGGAYDVGFHEVSINEQPSMQVGARHDQAAAAPAPVAIDSAASNRSGNNSSRIPVRPPREVSLSVHRISSHRVLLTAGLYSFTIDNVDLYVDVSALNATCWRCLLDEQRPDGLLGRTWDQTVDTARSNTEQYRERRDDLRGCEHAHDRFCSSSSSR